jgi:transposase
MSAPFALGIGKALPNALISYDRYHVVTLGNQAMDEVRRAEWSGRPNPDGYKRRSVTWGRASAARSCGRFTAT